MTQPQQQQQQQHARTVINSQQQQQGMPNVRYALCVKKQVVHFKHSLCAGVVQQVPHMSHALKGKLIKSIC